MEKIEAPDFEKLAEDEAARVGVGRRERLEKLLLTMYARGREDEHREAILEDEAVERIFAVVDDLAPAFLYYDRKGDEDVPLGAIEKAIDDGRIDVTDIVDRFHEALAGSLAATDDHAVDR